MALEGPSSLDSAVSEGRPTVFYARRNSDHKQVFFLAPKEKIKLNIGLSGETMQFPPWRSHYTRHIYILPFLIHQPFHPFAVSLIGCSKKARRKEDLTGGEISATMQSCSSPTVFSGQNHKSAFKTHLHGDQARVKAPNGGSTSA